MTLRFTRLPFADVPWDELDRCADRTVFQARPWLSFLADSQNADPVVASITDGPRQLGWFTGARVRRFGIGVLGSPLPGWTTAYQGFNLIDAECTTDPHLLLAPLADFAAGLGCRHVEVMDRRLRRDPVIAQGWRAGSLPGWELDLAPTPDELLASMTASGRRDIRRSARNGLVVAEAPAVGFASTFHGLLREVFARRGATITYPESRVQSLIDHVGQAGQLLLLTVREGEGPILAAGIFPGAHGSAYYWGGASRTSSRPLLPNEALLWAAITGWRDRGATTFDFGGGGRFKQKFGGTPIDVAWARHSRPAALEQARGLVEAISRRRAR